MMSLTLDVKQQLFDKCKRSIDESLASLKSALDDAQESANADDKGSAGDKHETGRAMMHLEVEKITSQLAERSQLLSILARINPKETFSQSQLGSLIKTSQGIYFLAIALGKVELDGELVFVISPASPIGKSLMMCKVGSSFDFNGRNFLVEALI
jgi:hypothetical protein